MRGIDEAVRLAEQALGSGATADQVEKVAALLLEQTRATHERLRPLESASDTQAIVTADGGARPGLLASIANVVANVNCGVTDVSQKTVGGRSVLLFRVSLVEMNVSFAELQSRLSAVGAAFDARIAVHRADIYAAMNDE